MNTTESKLEVAVIKCFFCGRDKGLVMNTRLTEKAAKAIREAHNHAMKNSMYIFITLAIT